VKETNMTKNETERRGGAEPPPQVHSREDEAADAYGLGWLCFTTAMGLGLAVVAVFTNDTAAVNWVAIFVVVQLGWFSSLGVQ
jgi:hypothetical protein